MLQCICPSYYRGQIYEAPPREEILLIGIDAERFFVTLFLSKSGLYFFEGEYYRKCIVTGISGDYYH